MADKIGWFVKKKKKKWLNEALQENTTRKVK